MKAHKSQSSHMLKSDISYHYCDKLVEQANIRQLLSTVNFCYNHAKDDKKAKFNKDTLSLMMSSSLFAKTKPESPNEYKIDMPGLFKEIFANWPVTTLSAAGVPSSSSSTPLPGRSHPVDAAEEQVSPVRTERAIRQQGSGRLSVAELRKFFSNE
ncbi:hypothetical protein D8L93_04560 [Sodalis-like symbiont of Bactericera trigonica]|nr:hypothetical protein D8L93_04560 [Sodalis-like symbiont of Bactericera trigonica]